MANEKDHLLHNDDITSNEKVSFQVYRRRWWILFLVSYVGGAQNCMWNTFGPISGSTELVLGLTDDVIALIANLPNIGYTMAVIPLSMLLESKGLRTSMILSASLLLLCTALRCLPLENSAFAGVVYGTAFLCGFAGVVPYGGPSKAAAVWFPPEERSTAVAIVVFSIYAGVSSSFIISPFFVPDPEFETQDLQTMSSDELATTFTERKINSSFREDEDTIQVLLNLESMRSGLSYLMYFQTGIAALLFLLVLAYFPDKPPTPPSRSASIQRTDYRRAFADIARNKQLWLAILIGCVPRAIIGNWIIIIDLPAKALGVSQVVAGWIGFLHVLVGCFAGIFIAKLSDMMSGRKKTLIAIMTVTSVIFGGWTTFLLTRVITFDLGSLFASCILLGLMINGLAPLFYELCAETAYPVGEGTVGGVYTLATHIVSLVYLAVASIPNQAIDWLTWAAFGSLIVPLPLLLVFKENNKRSDLDRVQDIRQ